MEITLWKIDEKSNNFLKIDDALYYETYENDIVIYQKTRMVEVELRDTF